MIESEITSILSGLLRYYVITISKFLMNSFVVCDLSGPVTQSAQIYYKHKLHLSAVLGKLVVCDLNDGFHKLRSL